MSNLIAISRRSLLTPFNVVAGIIVLLGLIITFLRFTKGLGRGHPSFGLQSLGTVDRL